MGIRGGRIAAVRPLVVSLVPLLPVLLLLAGQAGAQTPVSDGPGATLWWPGDPNLAFLLVVIGFYGLIFELANPGMVVPGLVGAISLMFGVYALSVLPVNYAGLGLIVLGIALMVGEAFRPRFGVLGVGGVIAFVVGATLLFDTSGGGIGLSWAVILGTAATTALMLSLSLSLGVRAHRRPVVTGAEGLVGATATVVSWSAGEGQVFVMGELWRAHGPPGLAPLQPVRVTAVQGLTVTVVSVPPCPESRTAP